MIEYKEGEIDWEVFKTKKESLNVTPVYEKTSIDEIERIRL